MDLYVIPAQAGISRLFFPAICPLEAGNRPQLGGWGDSLSEYAHFLILVYSQDAEHVQTSPVRSLYIPV
jgi:hypothetical protein